MKHGQSTYGDTMVRELMTVLPLGLHLPALGLVLLGGRQCGRRRVGSSAPSPRLSVSPRPRDFLRRPHSAARLLGAIPLLDSSPPHPPTHHTPGMGIPVLVDRRSLRFRLLSEPYISSASHHTQVVFPPLSCFTVNGVRMIRPIPSPSAAAGSFSFGGAFLFVCVCFFFPAEIGPLLSRHSRILF